jgi:hypothetical protein
LPDFDDIRYISQKAAYIDKKTAKHFKRSGDRPSILSNSKNHKRDSAEQLLTC